MRLAPIDKPRGILLRLAYAMSRRRFGKVLAPLRVLYARSPRLARLGYSIARVLEGGLALPHELTLLITTQTSLLNGCTFCADLHRAQAVQERLGLERFRALPEFETSPLFDPRERAMLAFVTELSRERKVSDATFARLRAHASDTEIAELTWLTAIGNYFNLMSAALELESDGLMELALREDRAHPKAA